ncbi:MAG: restriction endonuclease subunit S [Thiolinea sp.]
MSLPNLRFPEFNNSLEWGKKTFGSVATFYNGRAYKQEELLDKGKYKVLRVGNFFTNENWYYSDLELDENKYCENGDLLYAWSASFAPKIWIGEKVIYHYHIWKVVEKKDIHKKFLFILLDYETEKMKSQSANGLGLLHITKGTIEGWKCNLPEFDEQQKIADCLSSIDELITAQTQKLDTLKTHKKGLMQQLFPAEGETVPKLRFPEFRDAREWEEKRLVQLTTKISDGIHTTPVYDENGEYFFINGNNLANGKILVDEKTKRVNKDEFNKHKKPLDLNSILISINGTIGNLAFFNHEQVILGKSACFINVDQKLASKVFIYYMLQTEKIKSSLIAELTGSTIKNLSLGTIKNLELTIPTLSEQGKIADCLASVDALIAAQAQKIEALKQHKKGLMQQLFPAAEEVR